MTPQSSPMRTAAPSLPPGIPATRPSVEEVRKAESVLDVEALMARALEGETWSWVKS